MKPTVIRSPGAVRPGAAKTERGTIAGMAIPAARAICLVVVASKPFGESYLLAEMFAQLLEARGVRVDRRPGLGATELAFRALRSGSIDVYPEYTGTGLLVLLGEPPKGSAGEVYEEVYIRAFTPEGPASTHVFWQVARNFATEDVAVTEHQRAFHEQTLMEDKAVLEAIQTHGRERRRGSIVTVNADIATIKVHQIVEAMLARERGAAALRPEFGATRLRL